MTPRRYTGGAVSTNGYLLETPNGLIIIDAPEGIADEVRATGLKPLALLLTHHHFDHVEDAAELARMGASIHAYTPFDPDLTLAEAATRWGLSITIEPYTVDRVLEGEESLEIAGQAFDLLHLPGHSPDSLAFLRTDQALVFVGDTLLAHSIARTDLPGGRRRDLLNSIKTRLFPLPPATCVHPGHGPGTTIGQELASNPYFQ